MSNEELKEYILSNRESIIEDLSGFIEIPSVSSDKENVDKALDYALNLGKKMGFNTYAACNHQVGVIEVGEGEETVGILSHVDVVPPGDIEDWNTDPFTMVIKDGKLFGRGTMDDKGAIIICLYAMKAVVDSGKPLKKKIQMILGTQEEVDWVDMKQYVSEYPLPDYGFTPDGEFPLCNIEKGGMDIPMYFPREEESHQDGKYITGIDAGTATNGVPGKAKAVISKYENGKEIEREEIVVMGKGVHSCQPEKGINAIFSLAEKVESMNLCENQLLRLLMMTRENMEDIFGKKLGIYSKSETYNGEFVHRNAFAPTLFKMDEERILIHVNVRFAYGTETDDVLDAFGRIASQYGGKLGKVDVLPAVYISKDRPFMKAFAQAYEEGCGRENEFVLAYGGSYAKAIPNIVSWGPIFPGDEDTCHENNEYITIDSLLDNGKIFAIALNKVVLSENKYK